MKSMLEEMQEIVGELSDAVMESEGVYIALIKQNDNAKSYTLKNLLNTELSNSISLTDKMGKFMQLYSKRINNEMSNNSTFLKSSLEKIETIDDKEKALQMLNLTENTYFTLQKFNDLDIYTINMAMKSYINAIDRNFKGWGEFAKKLIGKIADTTLDAIPVVSEIKNLCQNVIDVAELMNEYEDDATEYSEVDKRLLEIEEHISVLQLSRLLIEDSIEILEKEG